MPITVWALLSGAGVTHATDDLPTSMRTASLRAQALAYEHGEGVSKDSARAIKLYCEAARLGDVEAQYNLGWMYANGRGVSRDDQMASSFFTLAAKGGHEHAHWMLRFVGEAGGEAPECLGETPAAETEPELYPVLTGSAAQRKAAELVKGLAPNYGVDARLALAVIRTESNFNPNARSPKNAQGLMQLMPETSARFKVGNPFDPVENIRGGLAYLRWLLAYFKGDVALVAAAYNAGEGTVNRFRGIPPYPETRMYVKRILMLFGREDHPYDAKATGPSQELFPIKTAAS